MRKKIATGSIFQKNYKDRHGQLLDLVVEDYRDNRRGSTDDTQKELTSI